MATYLILNGLVLLIITVIVSVRGALHAPKLLLGCIVTMLILTLVFDNLIIASGIVAYDGAKITGLKLFVAPVEDFAYAIAAVLLMPLLWKLTTHD